MAKRRSPLGGKYGGRKPPVPASFRGGAVEHADYINARGIPQTHYRGVHWHGQRGGWIAQLFHEGQNFDCGVYKDPKDAYEAREWLKQHLRHEGDAPASPSSTANPEA